MKMARMLEEPGWLRHADKEAGYLVGVSGGADSMALLHFLMSAGFKRLVVCHLNHKSRGEESDRDADFVRGVAAGMGMPFELGNWSHAGGSSFENAAREARHRFFAECAQGHGVRKVLLGHHADDQAETVLWNLIRGSYGLSGMTESQRLTVSGVEMELIRPLLGARKSELRAWLEARGLPFREDRTNLEPVTVRNRLRLEAFPLLDEIAGRDAAAAMARAASDGRELQEIKTWAVEHAAAVDPQGRLHVRRLMELPEPVRRACVFDFLRNAGIPDLDRAAVDRVLAMLEPGAPSKVMLAGGRVVRRKEARLRLD
ncbi:tRNA(Ile)-lysidine synthase [Haloferula sargassicola]|uniref:tRNA(Ile)-lysidine synthase n=2 Tax=Haloferula sargassicola TaxID=490096 RepID=A0ABP9URZ2_9BACT